jgi:sulfur carrier protein
VNVTVNGQDRRLEPGTTVAELVEQVTSDGRGCAVAVGGTVVPRGGWPAQELRDGDVVELVTAVQGG